MINEEYQIYLYNMRYLDYNHLEIIAHHTNIVLSSTVRKTKKNVSG